MKLYKFDYRGMIGSNVITVPTDSQFLIGIGNGDVSSTAQLFDGSTEIPAEEDKIGEYTCFRMETASTAFRKTYKAVIEGKVIDLLVICKNMSVAYRDMEGSSEMTEIDFNQVTPLNAPWQPLSGLVTSMDSSSTDTQYPSAKCVYDIIGDVETLINAI